MKLLLSGLKCLGLLCVMFIFLFKFSGSGFLLKVVGYDDALFSRGKEFKFDD